MGGPVSSNDDNDNGDFDEIVLLLVFDRPYGNTNETTNWYKWLRADDIPGSDVVVVSYDREEREWRYTENDCTTW